MQSTRKNGKHLCVPVLHKEDATIKQNAEAAGQIVAAYLRNVGMGGSVANIHKGVIDTILTRLGREIQWSIHTFL